LQFSVLALVLFGVAFFSALGLQIDGWPNAHTSRPDFASAINFYWGGANGRARLNDALTNSVLKKVGEYPSTAALVEMLDEQGFLARQEERGVCPSGQSTFDIWIYGCKNRSADVEILKAASTGSMSYYWGGFPCSNEIQVTWDADSKGKAQNIAAGFRDSCV
jgi:hypothetical protein